MREVWTPGGNHGNIRPSIMILGLTDAAMHTSISCQACVVIYLTSGSSSA